MKLLILCFLALCCVAMAQDCPLEITGTSDMPAVIVHGNHNVLAYILRTDYTDFVSGLRYFDVAGLARNDKGGLAPGDSYTHPSGPMKMHRQDGSLVGPPNKISVDIVLTSDGKFWGPDTLHESTGQLASFINSTREFAIDALANPGLVAATVEAFHSITPADLVKGTPADQLRLIARGEAAEQIDQITTESGPDAAHAALVRLAALPEIGGPK